MPFRIPSTWFFAIRLVMIQRNISEASSGLALAHIEHHSDWQLWKTYKLAEIKGETLISNVACKPRFYIVSRARNGISAKYRGWTTIILVPAVLATMLFCSSARLTSMLPRINPDATLCTRSNLSTTLINTTKKVNEIKLAWTLGNSPGSILRDQDATAAANSIAMIRVRIVMLNAQ